jgi:hypothetical protein
MIVITNKPGQLGNRLLVFANFIACAIENGVTVMNPALDEYAGFFRSTRQDLFCRYPSTPSIIRGGERTRRLLYCLVYYSTRLLSKINIKCSLVETVVIDWEEEYCIDDAQFTDLLKRKPIVLIQGWLFQERLHLAKHAPEIREFFRPAGVYEGRVVELLKNIRRECDVLVGVHIRHGDYRSFQGGKYFFEVSQYVALMKQVEALFDNKRIAFLICSNERYDLRAFSGVNAFFSTGHPLEDMYGLSGCDYIFGPPSTFSLWASFYGQVPLFHIDDINKIPKIEDFTCRFVM